MGFCLHFPRQDVHLPGAYVDTPADGGSSRVRAAPGHPTRPTTPSRRRRTLQSVVPYDPRGPLAGGGAACPEELPACQSSLLLQPVQHRQTEAALLPAGPVHAPRDGRREILHHRGPHIKHNMMNMDFDLTVNVTLNRTKVTTHSNVLDRVSLTVPTLNRC